MRWFLLFSLGGAGVVIVAACIAFLFARHRLNRYHRVDHRVPTDAPVSWLVDPRSPARLHRRLARVGTTATAVAEDHTAKGRLLRRAEPSPLAVAAQELCTQAVAVDHQLARLAVLAPSARRGPLAELGGRVGHLETAAARLVAISADARTPRVLAHDDPDVTDLRGQLERLAEAQRELDALDVDAGLVAAADPTVPASAGRSRATRGIASRQ